MPVKQINAAANASGRLLPFSLPFRFFFAACFYQLSMWILLIVNADSLIFYRGGPGPVLSIIHLLTLGVLAMTAIGASIQLLSVATLHPLRSIKACRIMSWFYLPAVAVLAYGMESASAPLLAAGGVMLVIGLLIYIGLVVDNLITAPGMGVITAHTWVAILSLCMILVLGIGLSMNYSHGFLVNHRAIAITHMLIAAYGFMGMLALGFSYILVPMFTLSTLQDEKLASAGFFLNLIALILASAGQIMALDLLLWSAMLFGLLGCSFYLCNMQRILSMRMRKRLGLSFKMIYLSWSALPLSIVSAGLMKTGFIKPVLFGVVLLFAWLLIFLVSILQKIAPFLATMHLAQNSTGKAPTLSELSSEKSLLVCNYAYLASLVLLPGGILAEQVWIIQIGGLLGLCAAFSLLYFLVNICRIKRSSSMHSETMVSTRSP